MNEPKVIEVFNDNGSLSHYALIDVENGNKLWSESPEECAAIKYAVTSDDLSNNRKVEKFDEIKSVVMKALQESNDYESIVDSVVAITSRY